jgi:lipid-binding SYLF domain-containing protein
MKWRDLVLGLLAFGLLGVGPVLAGGKEIALVGQATEVLDVSAKVPEKGIPANLLQQAQGVLILPDVVKASFVFGGRHGHGLFLVRTKTGWSNPIFVTLTGGSFGWQAGLQSADLVLVFTTSQGVDRLLKGRGKLTLGVDASIAAGPVGRQASAATDAMLRAEIYSYSRSRGLFLGLALEGDSVLIDWTANDHFYGRNNVTPADILTGNAISTPEPALTLRTLLASMTAPPIPPPAGPPAPVIATPVPLPPQPAMVPPVRQP